MAGLTRLLLAAFLTLASCSPSPPPEAAPDLELIASRINAKLASARESALKLRELAGEVLAHPAKFSADLFPERVYATHDSSLLYDRNPSGKSTVLSTGRVPTTPEVMGRLKLLEHLEGPLSGEVSSNPWIASAWVATEESLGVFYPPYDMAALVAPRLDVRSDLLPYRAAASNPTRTPVWSEPYVDITGKGYMVTVSVPVDLPGQHSAGVAGCDVGLGPVVSELMAGGFADKLLLSRDLYVIAAGSRLGGDLGIESLGQVYYLRLVEKEVPAAEGFRLDRNPDPRLRELAGKLPKPGQTATVTWAGHTISLACATIPETGWLLVEGRFL